MDVVHITHKEEGCMSWAWEGYWALTLANEEGDVSETELTTDEDDIH